MLRAISKIKWRWIILALLASDLTLIYVIARGKLQGAGLSTYAQHLMVSRVPVFCELLDENRIRNQLWIDRLMYAKDSEVRNTAAWMVIKMGYGPSATNALIAALDDEEIRHIAVNGLGCKGDIAAVKPLISIVQNDENPDVRQSAICSLGGIGDESALDTLIEILRNDKDENLRDQAASALGEIQSSNAVETLIAAMRDDKSKDVRRSAARALARIEDNTVRIIDTSNGAGK